MTGDGAAMTNEVTLTTAGPHEPVATVHCRSCGRSWPCKQADRADQPASPEGLRYEGQVREHFEPQRHFFEPSDGDGPCSTCGEDRDHDFIRVTVHYNDGDG